jgi:predicted ester cyclase
LTTDELIDSFQSAFSGRVRSAFSISCTPDIHYEDPLSGGAIVGLDALADHAARLWQAFPDARVQRAGERLTGGVYIAAPCRLIGTHRGELPRLPATGRALDLHLILYCELDPEGERLLRVRTFFDPYAGGVQLGLLPKPGTFGERALMMLRGFGLRSG